MTKPATRQVLNVFLASPSDVAEERKMADEVVSELNRLTGRNLGWNIELHKWEDIKPGYGAPQSKINPDVDACDIFVGLLWEHWGQPTQKYDSGFEEEFERAKIRRKETGEPEIMLVFKEPREAKLDEPGPELKKVLAFREKQKSAGEVLFSQVKDTEGWRNKLYSWLLESVFERRGPLPPPTQPIASPLPAKSVTEPVTEITDKPSESKKIPRQLLELSNSLRQVIERGETEPSAADAKVLTEFEIARLYLLAASWMTARCTFDFFGTHEANLLYKHRKQIEPTDEEEWQLLRTTLHDTANVVPGWFWFGQKYADDLPYLLFFLANTDADPALRIRALEMMTSTKMQVAKEMWLSLPLEDANYGVRAAALGYLGEIADDSVLPAIEKTRESDQLDFVVQPAAARAKIRILIRTDPNRAFSSLLEDPDYLNDQAIPEFQTVTSVLTTENLTRATKSPSERIRALSLKELVRRDTLSVEVAEALREDPSLDVREIAIQELVNKRGQPELDRLRNAKKPATKRLLFFGEKEKEIDLDLIAFTYYRTLSAAQLVEKIDWLGLDGPTAYKALVSDHYDTISHALRNDLSTGFERLRNQWLEKETAAFGVEAAERISNRLKEKNLDDFIRRQYTESLLAGLALCPHPSDVDIARDYILNENSDFRLAAARILAAIGDARDVPLLLKISEEAYGEMEGLTAAAAIRLSATPNQQALEIAKSDSRARRDVAVKWLVSQDSPEIRKYFEGMLKDEDESTRATAVRYLSCKLSSAELEKILDQYQSQGTYYYNVVASLDRILYAPSSVRELFLSEEPATSQP